MPSYRVIWEIDVEAADPAAAAREAMKWMATPEDDHFKVVAPDGAVTEIDFLEIHPGWSIIHAETAAAEGWGLFDIDGTGLLEIQRLDEADRFESDEDAQLYVSDQADDGSAMHRRALVLHVTDVSALKAYRRS